MMKRNKRQGRVCRLRGIVEKVNNAQHIQENINEEIRYKQAEMVSKT